MLIKSLPAAAVAAGGLIVSFVFLGGCVSDRPVLDIPAVATKATHVGDAIAFQDHGGPLDVQGDSRGLLTPSDAVRMTLQSDPDIQAAFARVRAAEADADQVRLLPNPIINASIRAPFGFGTPLDLAVTQDLMSVLLRPGRAEVADARLRGAVADMLTVVLDRLAEVQQRYAAVQTLDATTPILQERKSLVDRLLNLARGRLTLQEGTLLDVTTLQSQAVELDVEINERRRERRQERLGLARLIGQPSSLAEWSLSPWEPLPIPAANEAAWVIAGLSSRPELDASRWELAALGVDVRLAQYAPFLGTSLGGNVADQAPLWQGGPTFTIPIAIFDQGQFVRAAATAKQLEAEHKMTKVRRDVVEDVRKQYANLQSTAASLALTRDVLIPTQLRRQEQAEAAFKAGETDVTALILAQQDYQAARTKLVELHREATTSLVLLQRAAGGPGPSGPLLSAASTTRPTSLPTMTR